MLKRELEIVDLDKVLDYCFMKKIVLLLVVLNVCSSFAQDIEVKKFESLEKDQTAALSPRKDINGVTCGLVKVALKEPGAEFEGRILGDVNKHEDGYWVYLAKGTKFLTVRHPDYLPMTILFSNYGVNKIESGCTYRLILKAEKLERKLDPKKKGVLAFQLNPYDAELSVNGETISSNGDGVYSMTLPYGIHYYSICYKDFTLSNQIVRIDKQPKSINIDLTVFFAHLTIDCKTSDAAIYVNDELYGIGNWSGLLTPGEYVIMVSKEGYHTQSRTIVLQENDEQIVSIENLKATAGSMVVNYAPKGAIVYLDGTEIGLTPIRIEKLNPGLHQLRIEKEECVTEDRSVYILENKETIVEGELKMPFWDFVMTQAEKKNGCAMVMIGYNYTGESYICEDFVSKNRDKVNANYYGKIQNVKNYEKVVGWLVNSIVEGKQICSSCKIEAMSSLSECYASKGAYKESFKWAEKCYEFEPNNWVCSFFFAWHYYHGRGVVKNVQKAIDIMEKCGIKKEDAIDRLENISRGWNIWEGNYAKKGDCNSPWNWKWNE